MFQFVILGWLPSFCLILVPSFFVRLLLSHHAEKKTTINWKIIVVPANRRGAISHVEDSPFVLSPHIPDNVILLKKLEKVYCIF